MKEVYAHYGCQRWKLFLLPYVQMPLFISMSLTLRHMTGLALPWFDEPAGSPLKGLSQGGFGWVTDLTLPDPTWTFPLLIGAGNLINVEVLIITQRMISCGSNRVYFFIAQCMVRERSAKHCAEIHHQLFPLCVHCICSHRCTCANGYRLVLVHFKLV